MSSLRRVVRISMRGKTAVGQAMVLDPIPFPTLPLLLALAACLPLSLVLSLSRLCLHETGLGFSVLCARSDVFCSRFNFTNNPNIVFLLLLPSHL